MNTDLSAVTYPASEEIAEATKREDIFQLLRWKAFLPLPQTIEQWKIHDLIYEALSHMKGTYEKRA